MIHTKLSNIKLLKEKLRESVYVALINFTQSLFDFSINDGTLL